MLHRPGRLCVCACCARLLRARLDWGLGLPPRPVTEDSSVCLVLANQPVDVKSSQPPSLCPIPRPFRSSPRSLYGAAIRVHSQSTAMGNATTTSVGQLSCQGNLSATIDAYLQAASNRALCLRVLLLLCQCAYRRRLARFSVSVRSKLSFPSMAAGMRSTAAHGRAIGRLALIHKQNTSVYAPPFISRSYASQGGHLRRRPPLQEGTPSNPVPRSSADAPPVYLGLDHPARSALALPPRPVARLGRAHAPVRRLVAPLRVGCVTGLLARLDIAEPGVLDRVGHGGRAALDKPSARARLDLGLVVGAPVHARRGGEDARGERRGRGQGEEEGEEQGQEGERPARHSEEGGGGGGRAGPDGMTPARGVSSTAKDGRLAVGGGEGDGAGCWMTVKGTALRCAPGRRA